MKESDINRINELYHKSKTIGLSDEEKAEQARLRKEFIAAIRADMQSSLDNVSILNPDGTVSELKKKNEKIGD